MYVNDLIVPLRSRLPDGIRSQPNRFVEVPCQSSVVHVAIRDCGWRLVIVDGRFLASQASVSLGLQQIDFVHCEKYCGV